MAPECTCNAQDKGQSGLNCIPCAGHLYIYNLEESQTTRDSLNRV